MVQQLHQKLGIKPERSKAVTHTYIPEGLTLMEATAVNYTLLRIKTAILTYGIPSGQAIDHALQEVLDTALAANHPHSNLSKNIPSHTSKTPHSKRM